MDKKKWLQFFFYALASIIGLFLDMNHPDIKNIICQPVGIGSQNDEHDPDPRDSAPPSLEQPHLQW